MPDVPSPLEVMDQLSKIAEFCGGYRAKCEEAGFSPAAAEQMALQLHSNFMAQMERNSLPGARIDGFGCGSAEVSRDSTGSHPETTGK